MILVAVVNVQQRLAVECAEWFLDSSEHVWVDSRSPAIPVVEAPQPAWASWQLTMFCCKTLCWVMYMLCFNMQPVRCGRKKLAIWFMSQNFWRCGRAAGEGTLKKKIEDWGMECLRLVLIGIVLFILHNLRSRGEISFTIAHSKKKKFVLWLASNSNWSTKYDWIEIQTLLEQ